MPIETLELENNINPPNWLSAEVAAGRVGWNTKPRVINSDTRDEVGSVLLIRVCRTCQCAQLSCICDAPTLDVVPIWKRGAGLNHRLVKYLKVKKAVHGAEKSLPSFKPYNTAQMLCRQTLWTPIKGVPSKHPAAVHMRRLFLKNDRILVMLIHSTQTWIKRGDVYYTSRDGKNYVSRDGQVLLVKTNAEGKKHVGEAATKENLVSAQASTEEYPRSLANATDEVFIQTLKEKNADGWNVYVTMNHIHEKSNSRTKADIEAIRSVYCEVDENGDACLAAVRASVSKGEIPEPSIILQSSVGKYQFIWFVKDFTVAQQEAHDRALQVMFKTDPETVDCSRVLRLPDFYNVKPKYDPKPLVIVLFESGSVAEGVRYVPSDFKIDTTIRADAPVGKAVPPETIKAICGVIEKALTKKGIEFTSEEKKGSWVYGYLLVCPNPLHTTVDRYRTISIRADGVIGSNCYHSNCDGKDWKWFRDWLEEENKEKMHFPKPKEKAEKIQAQKKYVLDFKKDSRAAGAFDFVVGHMLNGTEGWFPLGEPSLIGGPSGVNKSTLMIDLLEAQHSKENFLGHPTYGLPYLILMADRGMNAHIRTARRMNFDPTSMPIKFLPMVQGEGAAQAILSKIEECEILPSVVFVEGCDMLVENASKMEIVTPFMDALQRIAQHYHIALIGSVGSAKQKAGEGYTSKRDNIFGSIAWSRKAETVAIIQYLEGDDMDDRRILSVLLRNGAPEKYKLKLENGRLVVDNTPIEEGQSSSSSRADIAWFRTQKSWFTVMDVMRALRVSQATAYRYATDAYAKRILMTRKKAEGEARQYLWNDSDQNPEKSPEADVSLD
jgi:hypothetical protein